ncbi:MAG: cytochrome c [Lutibacter sp.]|uniref:c-type cytochrome n=1 Tax=Lutibacter sp. TaxID=1925666 RepID=UPI00385EEEC4
MKKNVLHILIAFPIILFSSCENNVEDIDEGIVDDCNPAISFTQQIKPIIDTNCLQCHNGNQFPDLRTYQSIKNNITIIKEEIESGRMPLGGSLTTTEIEAIVCWVTNGSLNN